MDFIYLNFTPISFYRRYFVGFGLVVLDAWLRVCLCFFLPLLYSLFHCCSYFVSPCNISKYFSEVPTVESFYREARAVSPLSARAFIFAIMEERCKT